MNNVLRGPVRFGALVSRSVPRRAVVVGGSLVGMAALALTLSVPAGATVTPAANSLLVGSGSATTYNMMQSLDTLFNNAPGCPTFVPFPSATTPQELDFSCTSAPTPAANPENPYNDDATEETPLGSSNGIQQLEDSGAHGATATSSGTSINVFQGLDYARSSRALKSSDLQGLNFVAYAEDGVSWFHYTSVLASGVTAPSASASLTDLTQTQLLDIYNGTDTNWDQVCNGGAAPGSPGAVCGSNAPIVVFSAQEGSGTQSTWKTYIGIDPSLSTNPVNCYTPTGGSKTCVGPAVIFENEDAQITPKAFAGVSQAGFVGKTNPDWAKKPATAAQIQSDSVFFFSTGKYNLSCTVNKGKDCGGGPLPKGAANAVGSINGVAPTETNILDGAFPDTRYLYNVYSDGSNANIPVASPATLNYVSEIGFVCNPNKGSATSIVDPLTGATYLSEIQGIIEASGFYPLSAGAATGTVNTTPIDEGTLTNPASAHTGSYSAFDSYATTGPNSDPSGYCLTTSTDTNSTS